MPDTLEEIVRRLREIYSEKTVRHILQPQNNKEIRDADGFGVCRSECGESMKIWIKIRNDAICDTGFWTDGCAATIACGSISTELAKEKTLPEAMRVTAEVIVDALEGLPDGNLHNAELTAEALRDALRNCLMTQNQPWKKLYRK